MTHDLSKHDLTACRSFYKLFNMKTEGWEEVEAAERRAGLDEWTSASWADNYQQAEEDCAVIIADRFGYCTAGYVINLINEFDYEMQYRWWLDIERRKQA